MLQNNCCFFLSFSHESQIIKGIIKVLLISSFILEKAFPLWSLITIFAVEGLVSPWNCGCSNTKVRHFHYLWSFLRPNRLLQKAFALIYIGCSPHLSFFVCKKRKIRCQKNKRRRESLFLDNKILWQNEQRMRWREKLSQLPKTTGMSS